MRLSIVVCFVAVAGIATAETREAVPDRYYNTFSHTNPVFLRINQGDIVVTKTLDSGGMDDRGQSRATGGNPLTGPFYIDNAEPGDAILVHLRKVRLNRNWGSTAYRLAPFSVLPEFVESMYPNPVVPDFRRDAAARRLTLKQSEYVSIVSYASMGIHFPRISLKR